MTEEEMEQVSLRERVCEGELVLAELPDLDELKKIAVQRREHFAQVVTQAQAEVDKADRYIKGAQNG